MILNRYFLKAIFSYTATISVIFILIIVSSRSIQYLEQASRGEINPEVVFSIVFMRIPEFLELILPLSFFMSIVFVSAEALQIEYGLPISMVYLYQGIILFTILGSEIFTEYRLRITGRFAPTGIGKNSHL